MKRRSSNPTVSTTTLLRLLCLFAGCDSGCFTGLPWNWRPIRPGEVESLRKGPYANAPAVVMSRKQRILLYLQPRETPFYQVQIHDVVAILNEAGFKYATVRIPYSPRTKIVTLQARTISPDGEITEVDANRMIETEEKLDPEEGGERKYHLFRFPEVKVGSLLEFVCTAETEGIQAWFSDRITGPLPIEHYELEILATDTIAGSLRAYNASDPIRVRNGDFRGIRFAIDDVPARSQEGWLAPWPVREPWWVYRTMRVQVPDRIIPVAENWPIAMKQLVSSLEFENDKYLKGATPEVDTRGCRDPLCKVNRALDWARDKAAFIGFGVFGTSRPMKEVLESGTASGYEKALLVWHALRRAGVDARFACAARGGGLDTIFPSLIRFNHMLILVPAQPGIRDSLWLDPSCEHCVAGQVGVGLRGSEALVLRGEKELFGDLRVQAAFEPVDASPAVPGRSRQVFAVRVGAGGDAEVEAQSEQRGSLALATRLERRAWSEERFRNAAAKYVSSRMGTGRLVESSADKCDRRTAVCRRRLRFVLPGYTTVDGDRLLVPLTLLASSWDDDFNQETREQDLFNPEATQSEEEATIEVPEGYFPVDLPANEELRSPFVDYSFTARDDGDAVIVRRSITDHAGLYSRTLYPGIRKVVRAFGAVRQKVLEFRRTPPPAASPAGEATRR
jgi:hypothetical protein